MTLRQIIYLLLSLAGLLCTWYFNIQFMQVSDSPDAASFIAQAMSTPAASSLTMDIAIGALTGIIWMIIEARKLGMKHVWVYILLTGLVAFAFAFPLFLFMREAHLAKSGQEPA